MHARPTHIQGDVDNIQPNKNRLLFLHLLTLMVWLNNGYSLEIETPLHVHFCIKAKISFKDMLTHPVNVSCTQGTFSLDRFLL